MDISLAFHDILRRERESCGRLPPDVAKGVSVPEKVYRSWEAGTTLPTNAQFQILCRHFRKLRHVGRDAFRRASEAGDLKEAGEVKEATPRLAFGQHLAWAREAEQMSQEAVGALLKVTGQAVSAWETGVAAPVQEHYEALLEIFDALKTAPEPDWLSCPAPDGGKGISRNAKPPQEDATMILSPSSSRLVPSASSRATPPPAPTPARLRGARAGCVRRSLPGLRLGSSDRLEPRRRTARGEVDGGLDGGGPRRPPARHQPGSALCSGPHRARLLPAAPEARCRRPRRQDRTPASNPSVDLGDSGYNGH